VSSTNDLVKKLEEKIWEIPFFDVHGHLDPKQLCAQGLHHILLYHMSISELYGAGMPNGDRLSWYATKEEAAKRIEECIPYLKFVQNTSIQWGIRKILEDLYGWKKPITKENWRELDGIIRKKAEDPQWSREILKKANVKRCATESRLRDKGQADDVLMYSLEWAFFARLQLNQNDIPLFELEWAWNHDSPQAPLPISIDRSKYKIKKVINSIADVDTAMNHYVGLIPYGKVYSTAQGLSANIEYSNVTDQEMTEALKHRSNATVKDRDIYASYLLDKFLTKLEEHASEITFQFAVGAEPVPFETIAILHQRTISQFADIIARHPKLRFQVFLASAHANQSFCTMARELPNFSFAGFWWHNFFPRLIMQLIEERLDMVPMNKQMGFFSDAYHVDWVYGKVALVRHCYAEVLAKKIDMGQYTFEQALNIIREICYNAPQSMLGFH
jgi:glucuronate isomerase